MQTIKRTSGVSLLEVLAAIFVVSIGLLGVLAVIPFGAFQISKAQHAEYASNMLANAAEEIFIREMVQQTTNSTNFTWIEPHKETGEFTFTHISCFGKDTSPFEDWTELMRGQDDLLYTTYDDKRPDFADQEGKIQSSGKYTWFFTFMPTGTESTVAVDVLACHNRVPEDDRQVQPDDFMPSRNGGTFTLPDDAGLSELLTQTKYVFVTWERTTSLEDIIDGAWCKIVFVDRSKPSEQKIIATGALPKLNEPDYNNVQVYIPSGVLYHKRVENVPITD